MFMLKQAGNLSDGDKLEVLLGSGSWQTSILTKFFLQMVNRLGNDSIVSFRLVHVHKIFKILHLRLEVKISPLQIQDVAVLQQVDIDCFL